MPQIYISNVFAFFEKKIMLHSYVNVMNCQTDDQNRMKVIRELQLVNIHCDTLLL
jgi:hypothetical protein